MEPRRSISRRALLTAGAAGAAGTAGALVLASGSGALLTGCGSSECSTWSEEDEPPARAGSSASTVDGHAVLAALADVGVGRAITARTPEGDPIIIARPDENSAVAFSAKCPHKQCLVKPDGARLLCPVHDGLFNLTTGEPEGGPPKKPLPRLAVAVEKGNVVMTG